MTNEQQPTTNNQWSTNDQQPTTAIVYTESPYSSTLTYPAYIYHNTFIHRCLEYKLHHSVLIGPLNHWEITMPSRNIIRSFIRTWEGIYGTTVWCIISIKPRKIWLTFLLSNFSIETVHHWIDSSILDRTLCIREDVVCGFLHAIHFDRMGKWNIWWYFRPSFFSIRLCWDGDDLG